MHGLEVNLFCSTINLDIVSCTTFWWQIQGDCICLSVYFDLQFSEVLFRYVYIGGFVVFETGQSYDTEGEKLFISAVLNACKI